MKEKYSIRSAWTGLALCLALAGLVPRAAHAEDIDIYQGAAGSGAPNLLILYDNAAASDASASYTCDATIPGGTTKLSEDKKTSGTNFGFERCGLYKAVSAIGTDESLNGRINLGLMYFPSGGTDGGLFVNPAASPPPSALLNMDGTGVAGDGKGLSQMLGTISGMNLAANKSNNNQVAQAMQEAWAFYQGKTGLSGKTYPGLGSLTCARNFVLYITFATNNQKPQDGGNRGGGALQTAQILSSITQLSLPSPWKSPVTQSLASGKYQSDYSDEWAAFMRTGKTTNSSVSYSPITTYTIILTDGSNPDYEQLMVSMANQGGGTPFLIDITKSSGLQELVNAIKRVFADVQAVNSVFAAPVLPVSANTQGTYLNQIYMGMFRPDAGGAPRWMGNLKQYQIGVDTTSGSVELFTADASWGPYSAGKTAREALSTAGTGFMSTQAVSYWTSKDTTKLPDSAGAKGGFWLNSYANLGASDGFDAPDGQFVEKGGVGQQLRLKYLQDTYPATVGAAATTSRNVYTCPSTGCSGALSTTRFDIANTTSLTATVLNVVTAWVNNLINWIRGADTKRVASDAQAGSEASIPPTATTAISIRGSIHGDVLHSRPAVINYGDRADASGKKYGTVVFYGSNDGMFRAINGNQPPAGNTSPAPMGKCAVSTDCAITVKDAKNQSVSVPPGGELWSFVAPEFYSCLQQLYTNSVQLTLGATAANANSCNTPKNPSGKPYFFDGAPGVYWDAATGKAYIFLSARRGGRLLYALDVSDPANPQYMWKITNATSGFEKLGQTWSQPKVVKIKGHTNPVLIFGGGYDTNQDNDAPAAGSDSMGNAIYVVDAITGALVWHAQGGSGTATSCTTSGTTCTLGAMNTSIPADITLVDRDFDGNADRMYAADTAGNIWRVDMQPDGTGAVSTWKAYLLAALGSSSTPPRKFFFPPDVVLTKNYDAVVAVSGDREHPLAGNSANNVKNRFYMIKDTQTGVDGSGWTVVRDDSSATSTTGPEGMFNATCTDFSDIATCPVYDKSGSGFYVTLPGSGEKGVNAPTTFGGQVYFSTNRPDTAAATSTTGDDTTAKTCPSNLGVATGYNISLLEGMKYLPADFDGGGLAPSPVTGLVNVEVDGKTEVVPFIIGGGGNGGDEPPCTSPLCTKRPNIPVPTVKRRTYWYPVQDR
ncbi:pilus assembly protein [Ottowia sp.]|uniref:pilus assembly protein n=1 Tax=Ottowia sp. TaxID=1898956 RepID=UPI003C7373B9